MKSNNENNQEDIINRIKQQLLKRKINLTVEQFIEKDNSLYENSFSSEPSINKLTYNQKIVSEFINWLKSKHIYSEFVREFSVQYPNSKISDKDFPITLLQTASSVFNVMPVIDYTHTTKGSIYWYEYAYGWEDYLDDFEQKLNNIKLTIVHIPSNTTLVIECKDVEVNTHSHAITVNFMKGVKYYDWLNSIKNFLDGKEVPSTYSHPSAVYFESQNVRVIVEDNLFD